MRTSNNHKYMKCRKAQLKMGESMAILIIFFLLLGLGLIFYGNVQQVSIKSRIEEQFQKDAVMTALKVNFLAEVQCSKKNYITENCYDLYKLKALSEMIQDDDTFLFYQRDFHDSAIYVTEVYPPGETYVLYNNTPENYTLMSPIFFPINLKNSSKRFEKEYSFGVLTVEVYG